MEFDLTRYTPEVRWLKDLQSVLHQPAEANAKENLAVYSMYRGLEVKDGLRYDITVIPALTIGDEFIKTKGHYHLGAYPEIYIVLEGNALYLFQKKGNQSKEIEDVYAVQAKKGDVVIIPPYYGHVTINPSDTGSLTMANWISLQCKSDYTDFEALRGACYYYLKEGWIKNKKYTKVPELRFQQPSTSLPKDLQFLKQG